MATVCHVTCSSGLRKFQADRFLFDWVYKLIYITHGKVHPYQPLFQATPGRRRGSWWKETKTWIKKIQRTKLNFELPDVSKRLSGSLLRNKQLKKELLAPAPSRSRVRELNPRRKDQNRGWSKSDRDNKRFPEGNLWNLRPCLSLLHDDQSTDDSLLRKDKGEEMKPRTRPSKADGSADIFTSISMHVFYFLFLIIISGPFAVTSLSACTAWFHNY